MLRLNEKYEVDRKILQCENLWFSPSEISTINTPNSQVYINIPKEDSVISPLNSYIDLYFDVVHADTNKWYADGNDINMVNLGQKALFSIYKLVTTSAKHYKR